MTIQPVDETRGGELGAARARGRSSAVAFDRVDVLLATVLGCAVLVACAASGAFEGDFAANSDEPAHVVSALLVRAYLLQGAPGDPITFAEQYYVHYPKVAIGHWPPLFHLTEALWMLVFGASRASLVSLTALVAAALPVSVFVALRRSCGRVPALFCGAMLARTALVARAGFTVAPDALLGLLAFGMACTYGRYLDSGRRRHLLQAIVIGICATLTNGRGVALLIAPLWGAVIQGRPRQRLWGAVLLLPVFAVIWTVPVRMGQGWPMSIADAARNAALFPSRAVTAVGWPLSLLALCGVIAAIARPRSRPNAVAMTALLLSLWSFHALINVPFHPPYAITMAGAIAGLAAIGWRDATAWAPFTRGSRAALALVGCAAIAASLTRVPIKRNFDYHRLVGDVVFADARNAISLVAADPVQEGAYVAEVALRDRGLAHVVLRGSKVLAWSSWNGTAYRQLLTGADAIAEYLDDANVGLVVIQREADEAHELDLLQAVEQSSDRWREDRTVAARPPVRVFHRIGPMPQRSPQFRLDMRDKLDKYLELEP